VHSFDYHVARDGKWWIITIPAINGLTQARNRGEIAHTAREFVAVDQGIPLGDIEVHRA
jgi:hypothetical protein